MTATIAAPAGRACTWFGGSWTLVPRVCDLPSALLWRLGVVRSLVVAHSRLLGLRAYALGRVILVAAETEPGDQGSPAAATIRWIAR
jgi:hypothetical protein